ncbi:hypothetical protein Btru_068350 [Bulinus truncatus]|nr:hypothetical protein Btru_068350 [Bulinus truncatus]
MALGLREEFRIRKIGFQNVNPRRFLTFQWRSPGFAFIIYRVILAVYTLIWLGITADHGSAIKGNLAWGSFLTNWTYVLLTLYFTYYALVIIIVFSVSCMNDHNLLKRQSKSDHVMLFHEVSNTGYEELPSSTSTTRFSLPWYYAIVWILFSAVSVAAVVVTLVFWIILVPSNTDLGQPNNDNIQLHLINSVLILIEHTLTAIPVRSVIVLLIDSVS